MDIEFNEKKPLSKFVNFKRFYNLYEDKKEEKVEPEEIPDPRSLK